ncbi:MAG: glycosyltransferase family 2 protein, partial [Solirubrobacterales bacterium]
PAKPWIRNLEERISVEAGALVGLALILAGLATSIVAIAVWGGSGFEELEYRHTMRLVVPAATSLILGVQTVLASFFVSILKIERTGGSNRAP